MTDPKQHGQTAEEAALEIERLRAAIQLIWSIQVRKDAHLGYERYSGLEQPPAELAERPREPTSIMLDAAQERNPMVGPPEHLTAERVAQHNDRHRRASRELWILMWDTYAKHHRTAQSSLADKRDAERYRWLRDNSVGCGMHMGAVLYTPELVIPRHMGPDAVDAAIDAAHEVLAKEGKT